MSNEDPKSNSVNSEAKMDSRDELEAAMANDGIAVTIQNAYNCIWIDAHRHPALAPGSWFVQLICMFLVWVGKKNNSQL